MSEKSKALEAAIKQIEQNYGKGAVMRLVQLQQGTHWPGQGQRAAIPY